MIHDRTVMVLDDEPGVTRFCQAALERAGLDVLPFHDVRQAVAVLQHTNVDLLLVDIRMPEMDGFQVMEKAREIQPDLAILFMTGYGTLESALRALRMGASGLLMKPFDSSSELVEDVQRALKDRDNRREFARLQALSPLLEITNTLFKETDEQRVIDVLLDSVLDLLDCGHAGFYEYTPGEDEEMCLDLRCARGEPFPGEPAGFSGGPVSRADAWGTLFRVPSSTVEDSEMEARVRAAGMTAVLCTPVLRGDGRNSVLLAGRSVGEAPFTDSDAGLFSILANQAGGALKNARLVADLRASYEELQHQQQALIQAEKMAAIGRLTASIAHEVNNPLQAVRNCLHLVRRADLNDEKRAQYLELAQDELQRLMDTVKQMLDFYRPSKMQREPVDLNALIQTVLTLLDKQFQKAGIQVETRFAKGLPLIRLVRNQIQQVVFNILLNAQEAMEEGGTIIINTGMDDAGIYFQIEDTGSGVPEETRQQLFEPFISSKPEGTGLGLSVSYSILDAHGGTIELVDPGSKDGRGGGAVFRVTLPHTEAI